jgi:predicted S18 family serine protease
MAFSNLPDDYQTALAEVKMWRERHKQKRTWVELTDDDLSDISEVATKSGNLYDLRLIIEAKLKEKNCL